MFLFENYLSRRRAKIRDWQERVKRSREEYSSFYDPPYPVVRWSLIGKRVTIMALITVGTILFIWGLVTLIKSTSPDASTAGNCQGFNKKDRVRVQYGDYRGDVGTIVGGCRMGEDYQVLLDKNAVRYYADQNSNTQHYNTGNTIISINSSSNLAKIVK